MTFPWTADPADERAHAPGPELLWNESWYFDVVAADGSVGGYVRLGLYPNLGVAWYWACVVGPDRPSVLVVDHEVPLPRGRGLEVRHDGLWADHNVEEPLERWSLGLEAFGVALDHPTDAYRGMRGDRIPVGFDLEWETDGEVFRYPPQLDRYEVPCRVHGEILVGAETIELDGIGQRDHSWGVRDWWAQGWCWNAFRLDDGTRVHTVVPDGTEFQIGYLQRPGAEPSAVFEASVRISGPAAGDELPDGLTVEVAGDVLEVEPLAWAPVLLVAPDGRRSYFPRAMAAVRPGPGGPSGLGWFELNRPEPG